MPDINTALTNLINEPAKAPNSPLAVPPEAAHPMETPIDKESLKKIQEFITLYGPYITLGFLAFKYYTQWRLNKTLTFIEKTLKAK